MSRPFADLDLIASRGRRVVVGLMSGTSADSIDVAVCEFLGDPPRVRLLHYAEHSHDPEVNRRVLAIAGQNVREIAELHVQIAEGFARACLASLSQAGIDPAEVDLIGSHGQTVYHHSGVAGALRATLQLGDGDVIAVRTGRYVVSDFRARDVAAGGEGAPLSPIADQVLFAGDFGNGPARRAVLNLGGIGNLTFLDPDPSRVFGFDTGPANGPLDRLARRMSDGRLSCDHDGKIAASGQVIRPLLDRLIESDEFLTRKPPKSTGFEMYGDAFVEQAVAWRGGADADLMATLTEFSALCVARALVDHVPADRRVDEVVVAGGGLRNPTLVGRIAALIAPARLRSSDEFGVPADAREAMAFAVLADMTLRGVPAWLPSVTGASAPKLLGKLSFP